MAAKLAANTIDTDRLAAFWQPRTRTPFPAATRAGQACGGGWHMAMAERKKGRRPKGDGSVYKAADGRWRGSVDFGWVDGKRRRKYVAGATQSEALEKLRQAQRAAAAGVVTDDRITVGAFLERWLIVNLPGS